MIHVHHPVGALYARPACQRLGIPLLLHVHEVLPVPTLYELALRRVLPHCAAIICVSAASATMVRRVGAAEARVRVIHNGVNPAFLRPVATDPVLSSAGQHVGIFGVIEPRKGHEYFIAAAQRLKDRWPDVHFWIVGGVGFTEHAGHEALLRQRAVAAGMADRIHFVGHRADVAAWMAGMDVVVLASVAAESLPTVLIESAVLDRAIVATDIGGVREIITDGDTGLVVPPADDAALAAAIARLLSPEGRVFGARAGVDARRRFSPDRYADQLTEIYHALASQCPAMEKAA